jgi:magnesium-transporting ATPase (P-type)
VLFQDGSAAERAFDLTTSINQLNTRPDDPIADTPPPEAPDQVDLAVNIIWAILSIYALTVIITTSTSRFSAFIFVAGASKIGFLSVVNLMIRKGSNWSRMAFLVISAVGLLFVIGGFFSDSPFIAIVNSIPTLLSVWALYLLFTEPAKSWFVDMSSRNEAA